jgi:transposase
MLSLGSSHSYYLYRTACDMRKSFDSLSGLVRNELGRDPASGEVFVFVNKRRNSVKLLHWERGGFVLYYKRLEKGTFTLPNLSSANSGSGSPLSWPELVLMLEGIQVQQMRQKARYIR